MSHDVPEPSTCAHNLFAAPIRKGAAPEATDLCASPVGMVHMHDCPLAYGLICTYYAATDEAERDLIDDDTLVRRRTELHADYLRWSYRRRVRALRQEAGALDDRIPVEPVPEPDEEPGADLDFTVVEEPEEVAVAPPEDVEVPEERYPGQRRSEDRRAPRPARKSAAPDEPEEEEEDEELAGIEAADAGPKSIDELFATLPEAHIPEGEESPARKRRSSRRGRGRGRGGASGDRRRRSGDESSADSGKPAAPSSGADEARPDARRRRRRRSAKPAEGQGAPPEGGPASGGGDGTRRRRRRRRKPRDGDAPSS